MIKLSFKDNVSDDIKEDTACLKWLSDCEGIMNALNLDAQSYLNEEMIYIDTLPPPAQDFVQQNQGVAKQ